MQVSIFGTQKYDFIADNGAHICGIKVYVGYESRNVDGLETDSYFLSTEKFGEMNVKVGEDYDVAFNKRGKVEVFTKK